MTTVVDAARPAATDVDRAMDAFTTPTPRDADMNQSFVITQSAADTEIPGLNVAQTPINNTLDAGVPIIDYSSFWLDSVPATTRF